MEYRAHSVHLLTVSDLGDNNSKLDKYTNNISPVTYNTSSVIGVAKKHDIILSNESATWTVPLAIPPTNAPSSGFGGERIIVNVSYVLKVG